MAITKTSGTDEFCGKNVRHYLYIVGAVAVMILMATYYYKHYYSKGHGVVPLTGIENSPTNILGNNMNAGTQNGGFANQNNTSMNNVPMNNVPMNNAPMNNIQQNTPSQSIANNNMNPVAWTNNKVNPESTTLANFAAVADVLHESVVNINTTKQTNKNTANNPAPPAVAQARFESPLSGMQVNSIGSGFIVSENAHVLTNYHVIKDATGIFVTVFSKNGLNQRYQAEVIKADESKDLALLKISAKRSFTPVMLGDSSQVHIADSVIAIGSPYGLDQTVSRGIISGSRKMLSIGNVVHRNLIQTDAAINTGNSGGPLVNRSAQVIGINTAIYTPTGAFSGIGFAIPSNELKKFISGEIQTSGMWSSLTQNIFGMSVAARVPPPISANSRPPGTHNDGRKNMVCGNCHQITGGATPIAFATNNNLNGMSVAARVPPPISANSRPPGTHNDGRKNMVCGNCHQITGGATPIAFATNNNLNGMNVAARVPPPISANSRPPGTHNDGRKNMVCSNCHQVSGATAVAFNNMMGMNVAANAGPPIAANAPTPGNHRRDGRDKMECKMCHKITGLPKNQPIAFANNNQFALPSNNFAMNVATPVNGVTNSSTTNNTPVVLMGMEVQTLNPAIINSLNNPLGEGVFVSSVHPNTAAARSGIKAGDIIFKLDGRWINDPKQLERRLTQYANNDNVRLGIYRDGQRMNYYLIITHTIAQQAIQNNSIPTNTTPTEINWNGMELKPITETLILKEPQLANMQGAWVGDVDKFSVAEAAGLMKGDIITAINNQPVVTVDSLTKTIDNLGQQQVLVKIVRNSREIYITIN